MAVSLFMYRRGNSLLHRIPAVIKLAVLFVLCLVTFWDGTAASASEILSVPVLVRTAACLLAAAVLFVLSGVHLSSVRQLGFVLVLGIFVTVMRMLHIPMYFDTDGLAWGILYTARFFITSLAAQVVFETTSSLEIKEAVERCQNGIAVIFPPLKKWNPALAISLAINFIPDVFETWNRVTLAARARAGGKGGRNVIRTFTQEFSALFSCLLHHAETKRKSMLNRGALD